MSKAAQQGPDRVFSAVGQRLASCVQSPHASVASAAVSLMSHPVLTAVLFKSCAMVAAQILAALEVNTTAPHWCQDVTQSSAEMLRMLTVRVAASS